MRQPRRHPHGRQEVRVCVWREAGTQMSSKLRRGVGGRLGGGSPDKERGDGGAVDSSFIGIRRRWGA